MPMQRFTLPLAVLLSGGLALAQTAPTTPAAPPATNPAPNASPKTARVMATTHRTVSALSVGISKAVKGQLLTCPRALKVSPLAVCLYTKSPVNTVRPAVRGVVGPQALGDWKTSAQASSLLVQEGGNLAAYVLLSNLSPQETLVVIDAVQAKPAAAKPAAPAGVVKGQAYLLDSDLAGVVNVINLGGGKYRLNAPGQTALTITAGSKVAQRGGGTVDLPMVPLTDGKNLLFPAADLRSLGCTVTDTANGITIACGSDSVGVKPIVF
ncbi:hypothetical protein D3875_16855 [Deinococcus cavernae]|uniref:Copper amine oxidase N-terminal domain-containing protein n=1 Tax=Deinococcus cavernae TaxID=2320857 RepID=A0A418VCV5_9DEIO|nr:hypothetical protein [Deinococcus cavernae]RJF73829.1 hypothetical protein D3875_16855 [Deinococcus cavernae]